MKRLILNCLVITTITVFTSCNKNDEDNDEVDVYVVGNNMSSKEWVGTVWKNGVVQNLTEEMQYSDARSVFVSNNNVYVVGEGETSRLDIDIIRTGAKLWNNGVEQILPISYGCPSPVYPLAR